MAGPVLGVDGVLLDLRIQPEAVAVLLAVVEAALQGFAAPAASATAATPAAPTGALAVAVDILVVAVLGVPVLVLGVLVLGGLGRLGGGERRGLDLASISSRRSSEVSGSESGLRSLRRRKSRSSEAEISSWWAIQASVRPSRTQARIWFNCDLRGLPAIAARESSSGPETGGGYGIREKLDVCRYDQIDSPRSRGSSLLRSPRNRLAV